MSRIPALGPRGEGWTTMQALLMVAIVLAAWQASLQPDPTSPLVGPARQLGAVALLGGLALIGISLGLLRRQRAMSALPRPLETGSLVTSGPYRVIRHPIYAGLVLAGVGVALVRVSWPVAILTFALAVVLDLKRRREEAWLLERFPEYPAYQRSTKALVPFVY